MEIGEQKIHCDKHNKKCYFICIQKECQVGRRLLCTKCISSQLHNQHKLVDFEDANKWIIQKEKECIEQLSEQSTEIWRQFSSSKQKINCLLESIELNLIAILSPTLHKLKENLKTNNIFNIAQSLSDFNLQTPKQQDQVIDLQFLEERMNNSLLLLEELNTKVHQLDHRFLWKQIKNFNGHDDVIYSLDISPDGKRAVTGGGDMQIRLWDLINYAQIGNSIQAHDGIVWCVAYGQNCIISGSDDNTIKYWDDKTMKVIDVKYTNDPVFSLELNQDYTHLASGINNLIGLWNQSDRKQIGILKGHTDYVTSLSFYTHFLVSGSKDKSVRLWNTQTKQLINIFSGNQNTIRSVAFSKDGKYIASGGYDKIVRVWNQSTNKMVQHDHGDIIWSVRFLDNDTVITGGKNAKIKFWNLNESHQSDVSIECERGIMTMSITTSGNTIIAATNKDICIFEKPN
ncbi:unnamed protein product [Paramecium octaurelia]|uniref:Uncharacterized protein n=1 Tax=Paramecium octaurelia TaxID=43137 RepID=A0A8S1TI43_PAROT|nr:unnamed protein product [Paramecium octaurelia]